MEIQASSAGTIVESWLWRSRSMRSSIFIPQLLSKLRYGPTRLALHGADGAFQDFGHFRLAHPLVEPKNDARALADRKPKDASPQHLAILDRMRSVGLVSSLLSEMADLDCEPPKPIP